MLESTLNYPATPAPPLTREDLYFVDIDDLPVAAKIIPLFLTTSTSCHFHRTQGDSVCTVTDDHSNSFYTVWVSALLSTFGFFP